MARVLRGDVRWANLDPVVGREQGGLRPVVVISDDVFNARSGTVIAMAITSQPQQAGFPLTKEVASVKLPKKSWVKISQIRTISINRLSGTLGRISRAELREIIAGLNELVGEC